MGGEGKRNRARGFGFEREVVKAAQELGLEAERCWGSDGAAKGLPSNVDVLIGQNHYQCKRVKSLSARMKPDENITGQIFREDRGDALIVVRLDLYLQLLRAVDDHWEAIKEKSDES